MTDSIAATYNHKIGFDESHSRSMNSLKSAQFMNEQGVLVYTWLQYSEYKL